MIPDHIFAALQTKPRFWSPLHAEFPGVDEILMAGYLSTPPGQGGIAQNKYVLTSTRLIEIQHQSGNSLHFREGDIRWATIEPVTLRSHLVVQSGFSVFYQGEKWTFYAATDAEGYEWLRQLQTVAILRDFEGTFSLVSELGKRRMYRMYEAISLETGERVTVRVVSKSSLVGNERGLMNVVNEISVLRAAPHSRIAKLYQIHESATHVYMVFEHLHGVLLSESIAQQNFSEMEAKGFMVNLMSLLAFMETKAVLHRDLRPRNFLMTSPSDRTQFKLIDFSIARLYRDGSISDSQGSPGYIAPEVILNRQYSPAVDIYAAGIIFYMLIVGRNPFEGTEETSMLENNLRSEITFGLEWRDVEEKTRAIIRHMTSFNPAARPSASELKALLLSDSRPLILPLQKRRSKFDSIVSVDMQESTTVKPESFPNFSVVK